MEPLEPGIMRDRKEYEPPAIVYEALLEVRAGSPTGLPDPLNLLPPGK